MGYTEIYARRALTIKTQEAVQAAVTLAHGRRHCTLTHPLTALLDREHGLVTPVLGKLGVSASALRADLQSALSDLPTLGSEAEPTTAPELLQTLRNAERELRELRGLKDQYVSGEHVLLALTREDDPAGRALAANGVTRGRRLQAIARCARTRDLKPFTIPSSGAEPTPTPRVRVG